MGCANLQKDRLDISSTSPDDVLDSVQDTVTAITWDLVNGPSTLHAVLDAYRQCGPIHAPAAKNLDLVSHSLSPKHLLLLGNSTADNRAPCLIDDSADNAWIASLKHELGRIRELGVTAVRLLGCLTAWTTPGRTTILRLREALDGMEVSGTKDFLSKDDFGEAGFTAVDKLVSATDIADGTWPPGPLPFLPPLPPGAPPTLGLDLEGLHPVSAEADLAPVRWRATPMKLPGHADKAELAGLVEPRGKVLPHLLTVPDWEYHVPMAPGGFGRVRVLFDWRIVTAAVAPSSRAGRSHHAAHHHVKDPTALWQLMQKMAPGASVPPPPSR